MFPEPVILNEGPSSTASTSGSHRSGGFLSVNNCFLAIFRSLYTIQIVKQVQSILLVLLIFPRHFQFPFLLL